MTPQTLQGAALSDADIDAVTDAQWGKGCAPNQYMAHRAAARAYIDADRRLTAEQPVAWEGAEEWEPLAWELCANECGEDACNELIWEGGAVPEPWGERWLKYEDEAKRLIAMVRKYAPAPVTAEQGGADVGAMEYRGNTVSYIYDRANANADEIMRCWFVLKDFGKHPGRTDDTLSECLRAALTTQPQAEPPWDFGTWRARLMELVHQYDTVRDGTPSKAEAYDALWKHAGNIGDHWKARQFLAERESAQPQAEPADARIYWHASQGWQVEWLTTAPNGGASNYYRATTAPTEPT